MKKNKSEFLIYLLVFLSFVYFYRKNNQGIHQQQEKIHQQQEEIQQQQEKIQQQQEEIQQQQEEIRQQEPKRKINKVVFSLSIMILFSVVIVSFRLQNQLTSTKNQLESKNIQMNQKKNQLNSKQNQLNLTKNQLNLTKNQLNAKKIQLNAKKIQMKQKQDKLTLRNKKMTSQTESLNRELDNMLDKVQKKDNQEEYDKKIKSLNTKILDFINKFKMETPNIYFQFQRKDRKRFKDIARHQIVQNEKKIKTILSFEENFLNFEVFQKINFSHNVQKLRINDAIKMDALFSPTMKFYKKNNMLRGQGFFKNLEVDEFSKYFYDNFGKISVEIKNYIQQENKKQTKLSFFKPTIKDGFKNYLNNYDFLSETSYWLFLGEKYVTIPKENIIKFLEIIFDLYENDRQKYNIKISNSDSFKDYFLKYIYQKVIQSRNNLEIKQVETIQHMHIDNKALQIIILYKSLLSHDSEIKHEDFLNEFTQLKKEKPMSMVTNNLPPNPLAGIAMLTRNKREPSGNSEFGQNVSKNFLLGLQDKYKQRIQKFVRDYQPNYFIMYTFENLMRKYYSPWYRKNDDDMIKMNGFEKFIDYFVFDKDYHFETEDFNFIKDKMKLQGDNLKQKFKQEFLPKQIEVHVIQERAWFRKQKTDELKEQNLYLNDQQLFVNIYSTYLSTVSKIN